MASPVFRVFKGFTYGAVIGMFFGMCVYLLGSAVSGLGFISVPPETLGGITFATGVMAGVAKEYSDWLEENDKNKNESKE